MESLLGLDRIVAISSFLPSLEPEAPLLLSGLSDGTLMIPTILRPGSGQMGTTAGLVTSLLTSVVEILGNLLRGNAGLTLG